jgi:tetratricopeptide (TPR) repeat protein
MAYARPAATRRPPARSRRTAPLGLLAAAALSGGLAPAPAGADALLLKDGTAVEGVVRDKGTEWEVETAHGVVWVDKVKVKKQLPAADRIVAQSMEIQQRARALFEEAKKIQAKEPRNAKLRDAVRHLETIRDALVEAQETYTSNDSYVRLSQLFKVVIQEMRLYRDQFQVGGGGVAAVPPKPEPPPSPPSLPGAASGSTPPKRSGGETADPGPVASGSSTPPAPPIPEPEPELKRIAKAFHASIEKGEADEAYANYLDLMREGGEAAPLRPELARAFFNRGMKQRPPTIPDLARALELDSGTLEYREALAQASYDKGCDLTKQGVWNEATVSFTQAIRAATDLMVKFNKAKYHYWRGTAYHWRGIAETQKFHGKGGHTQLWSDYRHAKLDYENVLRQEPDGPYAGEARDNLVKVNTVLRKLSNVR